MKIMFGKCVYVTEVHHFHDFDVFVFHIFCKPFFWKMLCHNEFCKFYSNLFTIYFFVIFKLIVSVVWYVCTISLFLNNDVCWCHVLLWVWFPLNQIALKNAKHWIIMFYGQCLTTFFDSTVACSDSLTVKLWLWNLCGSHNGEYEDCNFSEMWHHIFLEFDTRLYCVISQKTADCGYELGKHLVALWSQLCMYKEIKFKNVTY